MIFGVYAEYDRVAQEFGNLWVLNQKTANRTFEWMNDEKEEKDKQDKEINLVGSYNTETGEIKPMKPHKVYEYHEKKGAKANGNLHEV